MIKKAMILAAGFGKRMQPLTLEKPKPLLKIDKETLLSNTLKFLEELKIKQVVINVHYMGDQIIQYIKEKKFNLDIQIIKENNAILDTGGGILNAINYFSSEPFLVINPDTLWNINYLNEFNMMKTTFFKNKKNKCLLLVVKKERSFDKSLAGDFNLENNLIKRTESNKSNYIYIGMQIIDPSVFLGVQKKIFSINKIWDQLIQKNEIYGIESNIDFLHVSTLEIYNRLKKINFKH